MQNKLLCEQIIEKENERNVSYILQNEDIFYDIGFRVMKNQDNGGLITCHKLKYNGKTKLMYFTDGCISLEDFLSNASPNEALTVVNNLVKEISIIGDNGFLNITYLDSRFHRIYVEKSTLAIKLIYLPLILSTESIRNTLFENDINTRINLQLQERGISLPINRGMQYENTQQAPQDDKRIKLISTDGTKMIAITKDEFIIGKTQGKVDGVISGNPAVSRIHCKIVHSWNTKDYIVDMGSANGTYLNGERVPSNEYMELNEGDRITLANEEFIIRRNEK